MQDTKENMVNFLRSGHTYREWLDQGGTWHARPGEGPRDNAFQMPTDEDPNPKNYIAAATRIMRKPDESDADTDDGASINRNQFYARVIAKLSDSVNKRKWAEDLTRKPARSFTSRDLAFLTDNIYWVWRAAIRAASPDTITDADDNYNSIEISRGLEILRSVDGPILKS